MKRSLLLVLPLAVVASSASAEQITWKISNATSTPITEIYLSLPGEEEWGDNRLSGTINPGEYIETPITGTDACEFDIKTVFSDGTNTEDRKFDLCDNPDYTIEEE